VIPSFLVTAVVACPLGAHPSPVQGYYKRDDAFFQQYHAETKTQGDFNTWAQKWVNGVANRAAYAEKLGKPRVEELGVKQHAYAVETDYGY
jgi:glutaconate CoA-transferase subunit A